MEHPRRKRGRPHKKDGIKADIRYSFYLYPSEAETLEALAKRYDLTLVDTFRHLLKIASESEREAA
jgi:hypothetical protein